MTSSDYISSDETFKEGGGTGKGGSPSLASLVSNQSSDSQSSLRTKESIHDHYVLTNMSNNHAANNNNNNNNIDSNNNNHNTNNTEAPLFDILPSYQMHQSILNRPLHSTVDDAQFPELLPSYTDSSSSAGEEEEAGEGSLDAAQVDLHQGSVLNNIDKLPRQCFSKDLKWKIELDQEDKKPYYTNGDQLSGSITIENASKSPLYFDMFFVTFEGETKLVTDKFNPSSETAQVLNFLRMVDLGASWTDSDATSDHLKYDCTEKIFLGLPADRILQPKTKYKKFFQFYIPSTLIGAQNDATFTQSELPPSFGTSLLRKDSTFISDKLYKKFKYEDLTDSMCSINYSLNARLIGLSKSQPAKYVITGADKSSVRFIPQKALQRDKQFNYESYVLSPSYQVKQLANLIEHNISEAQREIGAIEQDRRLLVYDRHRVTDDGGGGKLANNDMTSSMIDPMKQRNLYNKPESLLLSSISPSLSFDDDTERPFKPRYRKDYKFFRKRKKTLSLSAAPLSRIRPLPSESSASSSSLFSKTSPPEGWSDRSSIDTTSADLDSGTLCITSATNEKLILDFNSLINPLDPDSRSNLLQKSISLTLDFKAVMPQDLTSSSASYMNELALALPLEPDIDLYFVNVHSKGTAIPIDLDPRWFGSKKLFRENIKQQFLSLQSKIAKLPVGTTMFSSIVNKLKGVIGTDFESGVFHNLISLENSHVSSIRNDIPGETSQSMHLKLKVNQSKLKSTLLVPDFQSSHVSRLYFLRFKFKPNTSAAKHFEFTYDSQTQDVINGLDGNYKFYLDVPISIKSLN